MSHLDAYYCLDEVKWMTANMVGLSSGFVQYGTFLWDILPHSTNSNVNGE